MVVVPHVSYEHDVRPTVSDALGGVADLSGWNLLAGLGVNALLDPDNLVVVSLDYLSLQRDWAARYPEHATFDTGWRDIWQVAVRVGVESRVQPWLTLRAGAVYRRLTDEWYLTETLAPGHHRLRLPLERRRRRAALGRRRPALRRLRRRPGGARRRPARHRGTGGRPRGHRHRRGHRGHAEVLLLTHDRISTRDPLTYDVLMGPGTAAELDALARVERRFAPRAGAGAAWFEPACGTGRLLRGALRRGRRIAGYDGEPAMVAYARGRLAPAGRPPRRRRRSRRARPPACAGSASPTSPSAPGTPCATSWTTTPCSPTSRRSARSCAPGGVYAVGLSLQDWALAGDDEDVWRGARGRLTVTQVVTYLPVPGRRERVISHLVVDRPQGTIHLDHVYDLRTYTQAQWLKLLARSPLQRVAVCDIAGRPVADDAVLAYRLEILAAR